MRRYWFIVYAFFHPRDWTDSCFENEHDNYPEGMLTIVEKDQSPFGRVIGMITVFHEDFFSYTSAGSPLGDREDNIDGRLTLETWDGRPTQQSRSKRKGTE